MSSSSPINSVSNSYLFNKGRLEFQTWHVQVFPRIDRKLTGGSSSGNSTFSLLASPHRKAVLTSANMIDLFAPSSRFVIAREITVRIAIRHGVPANNSPRFVSSVDLACHKTRLGNWVLFRSFVRDDPLDADHLPSSSLSMDSLVTTRYTFILLNLSTIF